ncbi:metallophosphoesterase [Hazenella coriacea]|uniref:Calcineurin-like phosphoesterase domain-containing protein n=1 Tax=Hazenella coriacea TaxID=1179467 RepID=A0A4R3L9I4_9BACL|nr:metallophosphoesterase [Hazenella coriacea]TCS96483.1 hypothetical protein EDD58_101116 [Hazenella coriacea]
MSEPSIQTKKKITRRNFLRLSLFAGLASTSALSYSFFFERLNIEMKQIKITSSRVPQSFRGKRIVHISDIHFGFFFDLEELRELTAEINRIKPDLICFTGDFIDYEFTKNQATQVSEILKHLKAPLGKFAILGNHDYWGDVTLVQTCLQESGFTLLKNQVTEIKTETDQIYLSGLDDILEGTPDLHPIIQQTQNHHDRFHIMLVHEPDYADAVASYHVDLQLSGHSHGGQISFPVIGPLITPQGSKKYISGLYKVNERLNLYTSRGIGTTILPIRFLCRPELTVIEL